MTKARLHSVLVFITATIWLVNGLFCKVLNFVPRHEQIVSRILGDTYSRPLTIAIGMTEIVMAFWILSRYKSRLNAIAQITVIALMNAIELALVPDLLLWGKVNSFFAFLLIVLIYISEFKLKTKLE